MLNVNYFELVISSNITELLISYYAVRNACKDGLSCSRTERKKEPLGFILYRTLPYSMIT